MEQLRGEPVRFEIVAPANTPTELRVYDLNGAPRSVDARSEFVHVSNLILACDPAEIGGSFQLITRVTPGALPNPFTGIVYAFEAGKSTFHLRYEPSFVLPLIPPNTPPLPEGPLASPTVLISVGGGDFPVTATGNGFIRGNP